MSEKNGKSIHTLSCILALTLFLGILGTSFDLFSRQCDEVRKNTLRLHILAHSDAPEDQAQKLMVRDVLLEAYAPLLSQYSLDGAVQVTAAHLNEISETANRALAAHGGERRAQASLEWRYFPTRTYEEGVTLPAGRYRALRVEIGDAKGQNWWCVMYPPLCLPAAKPSPQPQADAAEASIRSLSEPMQYELRFQLVEWWEALREQSRAKDSTCP